MANRGYRFFFAPRKENPATASPSFQSGSENNPFLFNYLPFGASHIKTTIHSRFPRIVPIKIIREGFGPEYGYRGKVGLQTELPAGSSPWKRASKALK
jgi:hypothetical protein